MSQMFAGIWLAVPCMTMKCSSLFRPCLLVGVVSSLQSLRNMVGAAGISVDRTLLALWLATPVRAQLGACGACQFSAIRQAAELAMLQQRC